MMLNIEGVFVIYDGGHRVRLAHRPARPVLFDPLNRESISETTDHLWPSPSTGTYLRRQIAHGQKVVVVVEADDVAVMPTGESSLLRSPAAAVSSRRHQERGPALTVPLFDWLSPGDRARGISFVAGTRHAPAPRSAGSRCLIEESLIGTGEPLRFLVQFSALGFGSLQSVIRQLYQAPLPLPQGVPDPELHRLAERRITRTAA